MAAALVLLVAVDTGLTGWLLCQHFFMRRVVVDLGEAVDSMVHDLHCVCVQAGVEDA